MTATVEIPPGGAADLRKAFPSYRPALGGPYRPLAGKILKQVYLSGALFPSYAGTVASKHSTVVMVKGTSKATLTFSNATPGNNEFAIVDIYLVAKDGSYVYLGTEAAMVDVKKTQAIVKTTAATTQLFQATMALVQAGLVGANDLTSTSLTSRVASEIRSQHMVADPSTGLFSAAQLATFVQNAIPDWQRVLTINASGAREISIANDATNVKEANVYGNLIAANVFTNTNLPGSGLRPAGAPCGLQFPAHVPGTHPPAIPNVCATIFGTENGSVTFAVFGDSILVGASNGAAPYAGISQIVAARAPGTTTVNLGALQPSQITVTTSDPFDWSFGTLPSLQVPIGASINPLRVRANYYAAFAYGNGRPVEFSVPPSYSAAHPTVNVNGWNPSGYPNSAFQFCTSWGVCQALTSSSTFTIAPPFADPGNDLPYFNWAGQSGTLVAVKAGCSGYIVTPSANAATFSTAQTTSFVAAQPVTLVFGLKKGCGGYPPAGTTVQVEAVDSNNITYIGQGVAQPPLAFITIAMDTYLPLTQMKSVTISMQSTAPFATPVELVKIASPFTP